ncbi:MAG: long-chain fatty acid--CoA ligase [Bacteroidetes bacterium 4572_77]|nr:MAG: long-chain fatty acid--CoA ligase [Bacteroidetes bacterium 4572_77]
MEIKRTFDILDQLVNKYPKDVALAVKRNNKWEEFSTSTYKQMADWVSYGLLSMGLKKGDKIITVSNNRPEWNFLDMGMAQIGVAHVPLYPNIGPREYEYIVSHSEANLIIVSSTEFYDKLKEAAKKAPLVKGIYSFDPIDSCKNWEEIIEAGKKHASKLKKDLQKIRNEISEDDMLTMIYTSGTTGLSKGVMLSHKNLISNVQATIPILPVESEDKMISFLPLCHVFERMVNYLVQYKGCSVYYAESIEAVGDNIREIKPQGFASVPRVLEKVYDKIILKGKELTGLKKSLFFWAVDLANKYELDGSNGAWYDFQLKIAQKLIFSKWKEALGGNIKVVISGGAALQPRLARVFNAAGIPLMEGYGLTETSPVIAVNQAHYPYMKFGTVGPILSNVEVKIAEDGEILMKGPSQMMGYYRDPEKTAEAINEEGWFHTGDIGEIQEHNILKITDRKKEIFKLSTGKYIAPQLIENIFKESAFVEQIMIVGEGEKYAAAIICPSFEFLHNWCSKHHITYRDNKDLIQLPKIIERYEEEVKKINLTLGHHRQVKKFELTCQEWLPETGELSPTLKVKRKFIKEKYKVKFDRIYGYTDDTGHVGTPSNMILDESGEAHCKKD